MRTRSAGRHRNLQPRVRASSIPKRKNHGHKERAGNGGQEAGQIEPRPGAASEPGKGGADCQQGGDRGKAAHEDVAFVREDLAPMADDRCPVLALDGANVVQAFRDLVQRGSPLFRATRKGMLSEARMSPRKLHEIIQRRAKQLVRQRNPMMSTTEAEQIAAGYSTHSLRRGALTSLGKDRATLAELMDLGQHSSKSASVVLGYVEPDHVGPKRMRKLGI